MTTSAKFTIQSNDIPEGFSEAIRKSFRGGKSLTFGFALLLNSGDLEISLRTIGGEKAKRVHDGIQAILDAEGI